MGMTTSGLTSSLPAVRKHGAPVGESAPLSPPQLFEPPEKSAFLRVYGRALTFSVALHILLVLISPRLIRFDAHVGGDSAASGPEGEGGELVSYFDIGFSSSAGVLPLSEISPSAPAVGPGVLQPGATPVAPTQSAAGPVQGAGGTGQQDLSFPAGGSGAVAGGGGAAGAATGAVGAGGAGTGGADAAGILRPGYRDPRLYVEPPLLPDLEKTPQQQYAEHLSARIAAVRDSMAAEDARNRTTSDWVRTDGSGNRWGLSSEGLHLGGITIPRSLIPSPRSTGDNASQQDARDRQRQRDEIQRQEQDRARRTIQEERTRSMREADAAQRSGGN